MKLKSLTLTEEGVWEQNTEKNVRT